MRGNHNPARLGAFLPTFISENRLEGLFVEVDSDFASGTLTARSGSCDVSLGTGPGFADGAALGFPGSNEYYYLRTHPDAASAIRAGQYVNGLEHYTAVGLRRAYQAFAANATVRGGSGSDVLVLACNKRDTKIEKVKRGIQLIDSSGRYGTLMLESIEAIQFADGESLTLTGNEARGPEYKLRILQEIDKRRRKSKACRRPRAYCGIHPVRKGGSVPYARYTQPPANPWRSAIAASGKTVAS